MHYKYTSVLIPATAAGVDDKTSSQAIPDGDVVAFIIPNAFPGTQLTFLAATVAMDDTTTRQSGGLTVGTFYPIFANGAVLPVKAQQNQYVTLTAAEAAALRAIGAIKVVSNNAMGSVAAAARTILVVSWLYK